SEVLGLNTPVVLSRNPFQNEDSSFRFSSDIVDESWPNNTSEENDKVLQYQPLNDVSLINDDVVILLDIDQTTLVTNNELIQQLPDFPVEGSSDNFEEVQSTTVTVVDIPNSIVNYTMSMEREPEEAPHVRYEKEEKRYLHARNTTGSGKKNKVGPSIKLPNLAEYDGREAYTRVSRLIAQPINDLRFHHSYGLTSGDAGVIAKEGSLYYPITSQDKDRGSQSFSKLRITRKKEDEISYELSSYSPFEISSSAMVRCDTHRAKEFKDDFSLNKSILAFDIVVKSPTGEYQPTGISCMSQEILESPASSKKNINTVEHTDVVYNDTTYSSEEAATGTTVEHTDVVYNDTTYSSEEVATGTNPISKSVLTQ
ncbi:unnamed protein product, partial [Didymodactylos carnosus]